MCYSVHTVHAFVLRLSLLRRIWDVPVLVCDVKNPSLLLSLSTPYQALGSHVNTVRPPQDGST